MYGDRFKMETTNVPGTFQLPVRDEIAGRYPNLAAVLGGIHGNPKEKGSTVPPAAIFVRVNDDGLAITISPVDHPQVATCTVSSGFDDVLGALEAILRDDRITWKDRWKAPGRQR